MFAVACDCSKLIGSTQILVENVHISRPFPPSDYILLSAHNRYHHSHTLHAGFCRLIAAGHYIDVVWAGGGGRCSPLHFSRRGGGTKDHDHMH